MTIDFNVAIDFTKPPVPTVAVTGEVDVATASELLHRLLTLAASHPPAIVVDLTGVGFLDSSGIIALAQTHKQLRSGGGQLIVVTSAPMILRLFEITGTDRVFRVFPTLAEAIGHNNQVATLDDGHSPPTLEPHNNSH